MWSVSCASGIQAQQPVLTGEAGINAYAVKSRSHRVRLEAFQGTRRCAVVVDGEHSQIEFRGTTRTSRWRRSSSLSWCDPASLGASLWWKGGGQPLKTPLT